jgi:hypothetical protein
MPVHGMPSLSDWDKAGPSAEECSPTGTPVIAVAGAPYPAADKARMDRLAPPGS